MRYPNRRRFAQYGVWWFFFVVLLVISIGIGWVINIIDLVHMDAVLSGLGVVRIAGIFIPPLGAIMGYFY